jgi:PAS domain S-box-containing protein
MTASARSLTRTGLAASAVLAVDLQGGVLYCNGGAERITGWFIAEAQGRPIDAVFALTGTLPRWRPSSMVRSAMDSDRAVMPPTYGLLRNRIGLAMLVEYSVTPIHGRDGLVTGAMIVFQDVTRQLDLRAVAA